MGFKDILDHEMIGTDAKPIVSLYSNCYSSALHSNRYSFTLVHKLRVVYYSSEDAERRETLSREAVQMAAITVALVCRVTLGMAQPAPSFSQPQPENNPDSGAQSAVLEVSALAFVLVVAATMPLVSWLLLVSMAIGFRRGLDALLGVETVETLFGRRHFGGTLRVVERIFRWVIH